MADHGLRLERFPGAMRERLKIEGAVRTRERFRFETDAGCRASCGLRMAIVRRADRGSPRKRDSQKTDLGKRGRGMRGPLV